MSTPSPLIFTELTSQTAVAAAKVLGPERIAKLVRKLSRLQTAGTFTADEVAFLAGSAKAIHWAIEEGAPGTYEPIEPNPAEFSPAALAMEEEAERQAGATESRIEDRESTYNRKLTGMRRTANQR